MRILKEILVTLQDSKVAEPSGKDKLSRFWVKYKKVSEEYDTEFLDRHNGNMDIVLVFVSCTVLVCIRALIRYEGRLVLCGEHRVYYRNEP